MSFGTLGTEVASEIISKIDEVLTPDLDSSVAIFRAVSRVYASNYRLLVVSEWVAGVSVVKFACQTHCERNNLSLVLLRRAFALDTN